MNVCISWEFIFGACFLFELFWIFGLAQNIRWLDECLVWNRDSRNQG